MQNKIEKELEFANRHASDAFQLRDSEFSDSYVNKKIDNMKDKKIDVAHQMLTDENENETIDMNDSDIQISQQKIDDDSQIQAPTFDAIGQNEL